MFSSVRQDFSFAVRQFRRSPGVTSLAILTLALGIGASAAVFSLVDGILLRPLPFPNANRLVAINTLEFAPGVASRNPEAGYAMGSSYPNFFDWQRQNHSFDSLASCDQISRLFSKPNGDGARVLDGARVSVNLFSTLGVTTALGRPFAPEEELPGHRVVILSHELWESDFGGSPSALGQTVNISDVPYAIIGIMPAGFHYPVDHPANYWSTFSIDSEGPEPLTSQREANQLSVVGRLKAGVERKQALADLNTIQRGLAQQYSENRYRPGVLMASMLDDAVSDARSGLMFLFVAVGVVLIIGCTNVAGLLLARASTRRGEVAVRAALGAGRVRLLRQFLLESLLLAVAGGAVGVPLSFLLLRLGLQIVPFDLPRVYSVGMDGRVLTFAILLSASTALMFGLLPAWRVSQLSPAVGLRDGSLTMTSGRGRNRLHHGLVVVETALGFALLIGSGLLIRAMVNVLSLRPGFDTERTIEFDVAITNQRYPDPHKVLFYDKLLPQLAALPGVKMVSGAHPLPLRWPVETSFTIAGHVNSEDDLPSAGATVTEPGYFETLSIPLVRGRTFTAHDNDAKSAPVAVINQSFARQFFPDEDPIGRYFTPRFEHRDKVMIARQIVGIVGDTQTPDLWNPYPYQPQFYLPYAQEPTHQRPIVVMKVAGDPWSYADTVRKIVAGVDKNAPVFGYRPLALGRQNVAAHQRFEASMVSAFAGIALLLAAIGLYAMLSYVVAERTREIGLRMALGASRSDVLTLVLRRGLLLAGLGIGIGALSSLIMGRLMTSLLFGVAPLDPPVFGTVILVFILVSIAATLVPAIRAAGLDPIRTLRDP